ncbi:MAG: prephenate dehydrogenase/arogenate dehydrogenase family protein [Dehalococcoidia bacterium]
MSKIAIIGLGLIGGSIGLGLKESRSPGLEVFGYDTDYEVGKRAVRRGAIDKAPWHLPDVVEGANMVILATPVMAIREVMETIAEMLSPGCVVTDTGSTKKAVMDWAEEYLPKEVSFVGGHPMAGKELSGINNADSKLFQGGRYVVIPDKRAKEDAVKSVLDLVDLLGARPYFLQAQEHDSYVAAVSHLPMILSTVLTSATAKSPSWREISKLAATGFRDVSRLASGDPVMHLDICVTNKESIVYWLNETIKELQIYRDMIGGVDDEVNARQLGDSFAKAWESREMWLFRYNSGQDEDDSSTKPNLPSASESLADLFVGTRLRERYQQMFALQERKDKERSQRRRRGR